MQQRLFESPRVRLELYDLARDFWELENVADDPRYAGEVRRLADVLQRWMEDSDAKPGAAADRGTLGSAGSVTATKTDGAGVSGCHCCC